MLAVKQDHINDREEFINISIAYAPLTIEANMYSLILELTAKRDKSLRLYGGFSSAEGNPSSLTEEGTFTQSTSQDFGLLNELSSLAYRYGIGISTIETLEVAALKEYNQAKSRPVKRAHGLKGVNA